jgi:hypothetical protein
VAKAVFFSCYLISLKLYVFSNFKLSAFRATYKGAKNRTFCMKITNLCTVCILLFFQCNCTGQKHITHDQDNEKSYKVSLREYKVDTCLTALLKSIVGSDSDQKRYPPKFYYYLMQFEEAASYRKMLIYPKRWPKDWFSGCLGIIEIDGMSFLLCTVHKGNGLFTDTGKDIAKNISYRTMSDSLEREEKKLVDWENSPTSLIGSAKLCEGKRIDLYINVGSKIDGFDFQKPEKNKVHSVSIPCIRQFFQY